MIFYYKFIVFSQKLKMIIIFQHFKIKTSAQQRTEYKGSGYCFEQQLLPFAR